MKVERQKSLLKVLAIHQTATFSQLAELLAVSEATVRRDINWLADRNLIARKRGGAQSVAPRTQQQPRSIQTFATGIICHAARKRAIARRAAAMCSDGEAVIINSGTTTFMMAEYLVDRQMKILTNSFQMAHRLLTTSDNEIIVPGGEVYREQQVILAPHPNDVTQNHYASKMFTSVHGLSLLGLVETDPMLIKAERRLISQAEELIVMADSSKFGKNSGLIVCALDQVDCVITDTDVSERAVQMLEQQGIKVVTVSPEPANADHGPSMNRSRETESAELSLT